MDCLLPRRRRLYWVTATVALGAPLSTAWWVNHETDALAAHASAKAGVPARVGTVDVDLTGEVTVSDVALGDVIAADTITASAFGGEVRVSNPRVAIRVDADGDSDLARIARKLAPKHSAQPPTAHASRKIVVDDGRLVAHVANVGDLTADDVELVPSDTGLKVTSGAVHVRGTAGPAAVDLVFARAAAEVALPSARVGRVLAVAGTGSVAIGAAPIVLHDAAAGRLDTHTLRALEIRANVDDHGIPRPIAVSLQLADKSRDLALALEGDRVPLAGLAPLAPPGLVLDHARGTGTLTLKKTPGTIELTVDGAVSDATLDHKTLAPQPITLSSTLHGTLALAPEAIVVRDGRLRIGDVDLTASGWLRRAAPTSGQLDITLASAPCARLLDALPAALRGPLDGLTLAGDLAGHAHLGIDLAAPDGDGVQLAVAIANSCKVLAEPPAADVHALAAVAEQTYPDGTHARVGPGSPGWIDLGTLPGRVPGAFISAEDGRFREHHGFDATQIARSFEIDLREHRLARGGSTISQQLVKNAFLTQRRSLDRKIQEAILTWRLEDRLSKKQILERYLNIIELGPHTYGIGAAALHWFGTAPKNLTVRQAAFLAALTSEPTTMSRRVRAAGGLDPDSLARVDTILRAMRRDGAITTDEFDAAKRAPLAFSPAALDAEK